MIPILLVYFNTKRFLSVRPFLVPVVHQLIQCSRSVKSAFQDLAVWIVIIVDTNLAFAVDLVEQSFLALFCRVISKKLYTFKISKCIWQFSCL